MAGFCCLRTFLSTSRLSILVFCPHGFYCIMQFMLGRVQMLFGLRAVALHIVMVGGAGMIHLSDGFIHVVVDSIQIVPVVNSFGNRDSYHK